MDSAAPIERAFLSPGGEHSAVQHVQGSEQRSGIVANVIVRETFNVAESIGSKSRVPTVSGETASRQAMTPETRRTKKEARKTGLEVDNHQNCIVQTFSDSPYRTDGYPRGRARDREHCLVFQE
jgi:hypothetical protein